MDQESNKTLYLHMGGVKTGTSSIQYFATRERENLLAQYGLYYPHTGRWPAVPSFDIHAELIPPDDRVWKTLRAEVAAQKHSKVLVSCEWMLSQIMAWARQDPHARDGLLPKIRTYFPDHTIKVILYLRRFDDALKSWVNQVLKSARHNLSFAEFPLNAMYENLFHRAIELQEISAYEKRGAPHLGLALPQIETGIKIFGKENVIMRFYDRSWLKEGNAVVDIFDAMGIALQGELLEAARRRQDNPKTPDETLPFFSKLWQIADINRQMNMSGLGKEEPFVRAVASKIQAAFDPTQQGSGTGLGMESELEAIIDRFEALAPGYRNLFTNRPCSFSFPEIDLAPKELLKFDLLCSLYKNDFRQPQAFADLKEQIVADIERALFPNLAQRLALLLASPVFKLSLSRDRYAVFRKTPDAFLAAPDHYPAKRLRKILRFFGPIPPPPRKAAGRERLDPLEENLDYLLAAHGRLAFWGLGN
jgi:hypothetical protein